MTLEQNDQIIPAIETRKQCRQAVSRLRAKVRKEPGIPTREELAQRIVELAEVNIRKGIKQFRKKHPTIARRAKIRLDEIMKKMKPAMTKAASLNLEQDTIEESYLNHHTITRLLVLNRVSDGKFEQELIHLESRRNKRR